MTKLLYNLFILVGLSFSPLSHAQIVLQALDAPSFTPSEKCLELVYDRNYGDGDHNFIYCAVQGPNGKKWLNLNLGAEYAREDSPYFNPEAQPTDYKDWKAFGSLFQEGRRADGHELVTYYHSILKTDYTADITERERPTPTNDYWYVNRKYPITTYHQDAFNSGRSFVMASDDWMDFKNRDRINYSGGLWNNEMKNNPCPKNYRVIDDSDIRMLIEDDVDNTKIVIEPKNIYTTASILINKAYPNLVLMTSPVFIFKYYSENLHNTNSSYSRFNITVTKSILGGYVGTSSLWITNNNLDNKKRSIYRFNKKWYEESDFAINSYINVLDFGFYRSEKAYATYGISDGDHSYSMAIRCIEK